VLEQLTGWCGEAQHGLTEGEHLESRTVGHVLSLVVVMVVATGGVLAGAILRP
jgi:hypothetical protein